MGLVPLTRGGPEAGGNFEFHWSNGNLEAHLLSDVGRYRQQNEDHCILCAPEDARLREERGVLLAVADGMGGVHGGEFASRLALQTITERYYDDREPELPSRMRRAVIVANQRIYEEAENHPEYQGMGTTVSVLVLHGDQAYIAQVGDSRVYMHRDGKGVTQITEDHSLVAEQVRNGYLSEDEAKNHSLKNLITRAVGTREVVKVDLFVFDVQKNDDLLICSDGLSNMVESGEIQDALAMPSLQGAGRTLVGRALNAGGSDNITAAMMRVTSDLPKTERQQGAVPVTPFAGGFFGRLKRIFRR
jgi:protein phosphatase